MLLGDLRRGADQLEVGLDHRRAAQRYRGISLGVEPAGELVSLGWRCSLEPLDAADCRVCRPGENECPPAQASLLGLGIEQREGDNAAGKDGRQQPVASLGEGADRPLVRSGLENPHARSA